MLNDTRSIQSIFDILKLYFIPLFFISTPLWAIERPTSLESLESHVYPLKIHRSIELPSSLSTLSELLLLLEASWNYQVNQLGFAAAPIDHGAGGSDAVDVYIDAMPVDEAGVTIPDFEWQQQATGPSYIRINATLSAEEMRITLSHELNHVLQNGIYAHASSLWKEATATAVEVMEYPAHIDWLNDAQVYQENSQAPLYMNGEDFAPYARDEVDGYDYGAALWLLWMDRTDGQNDGSWLAQQWYMIGSAVENGFHSMSEAERAVHWFDVILEQQEGATRKEQFALLLRDFTSWRLQIPFDRDLVPQLLYVLDDRARLSTLKMNTLPINGFEETLQAGVAPYIGGCVVKSIHANTIMENGEKIAGMKVPIVVQTLNAELSVSTFEKDDITRTFSQKNTGVIASEHHLEWRIPETGDAYLAVCAVADMQGNILLTPVPQALSIHIRYGIPTIDQKDHHDDANQVDEEVISQGCQNYPAPSSGSNPMQWIGVVMTIALFISMIKMMLQWYRRRRLKRK